MLAPSPVFTSTSRFWETFHQLNYCNGHLWPISLTRNEGLQAFLSQGKQGGDFTYTNYIYQNFLLEAMIWQLRFSLCKTPITCYHYQPLLTKSLSKCSPARHWAMPIFFCEAWLHTDGEPRLHNIFFSFLFFNLLLPDAPKNNPAQMDRVTNNHEFWIGIFAYKQHCNPWKGGKNVTSPPYQVHRTNSDTCIQSSICANSQHIFFIKLRVGNQTKHTILTWALPVSNLLNSGFSKYI